MDKRRFLLVAAGIVALLLLGWMNSGHKDIRRIQDKPDTPDIQSLMDLFPDSASVVFPDLTAPGQESVKTVDESVIPYLVPELCGYNSRDLRVGIITVRSDIDSLVYARSFPQTGSGVGRIDSIADVYLYIRPMDIFPEGEYGRVAYVLSNDTVIQIQFIRGGVDEMVSDVSSRLDAVSSQLQDLARQMENNKKDR